MEPPGGEKIPKNDLSALLIGGGKMWNPYVPEICELLSTKKDVCSSSAEAGLTY